jgi:hypothetical protein
MNCSGTVITTAIETHAEKHSMGKSNAAALFLRHYLGRAGTTVTSDRRACVGYMTGQTFPAVCIHNAGTRTNTWANNTAKDCITERSLFQTDLTD